MLVNLTSGAMLGVLGALSMIVNIIVQLIKDYFPNVPTKIITLIMSIVVCLTYSIMEMGFTAPAMIFGLFGGFIVAYASMNGFDTIKEIKNRFSLKDGGEGDDK